LPLPGWREAFAQLTVAASSGRRSSGHGVAGLLCIDGGVSRAAQAGRLCYEFFGERQVTIDKTLKRKGRLARSRNVLRRHERIEKLQFEDRWEEGRSPLGLPKVRVVKTVIGKKKKKKAKEEEK
jgi:small basic protein (TIGR04137 family)